MKIIGRLVLVVWFGYASFAGYTWASDRYLHPDRGAIMIAVCGLAPTIAVIDADGSLDFVPYPDDKLAEGRLLDRMEKIRMGHKYLIQSECPKGAPRSSL